MSQATGEYSQARRRKGTNAANYLKDYNNANDWHKKCSLNAAHIPMRPSDILLVISALAGSALSCAPKTSSEATEVPTGPRGDADGSCRHELGRCGGHTAGDGACRGAASGSEETRSATPTPLDDVVIEPGKFAEINLEMAEGSATDIAFQAAGGPLKWNVHSHDGDKVVIHAEGVGAEGSVRFVAPRAGPYSYLWKNVGTTSVRLTARLTAQGMVRVHSVLPVS